MSNDGEAELSGTGRSNSNPWLVILLKIMLDAGRYMVVLAYPIIFFYSTRGMNFNYLGAVGMAIGSFSLFAVIGPLIGGVLGEKLGYKRTLLVLFGGDLVFFILLVLITGLLMVANVYFLLILPLAMAGLLSGAAVPVFLATIAKAKKPKDRAGFFLLYFWIVQLGSSIVALIWVPVSIALAPALYYSSSLAPAMGLIFFGAILVAVDLVLVWRIYKEPAPISTGRGSLKVLEELKVVFSDKHFVAFLFIMVGYFMLAGFQGRLAASTLTRLIFSAGITTTIFTYGLVLMLAGLLTTLVVFPGVIYAIRRQPPIRWLVIGIFISVAGIFFSGILPSIIPLVVGEVLSLVGFFIATSMFYVIVAGYCRNGRFGLYMSAAFLPGIASFILGGVVLGGIFTLMTMSGLTGIVMALSGSVGLATIILLIVHHKRTAVIEEPPEVVEPAESAGGDEYEPVPAASYPSPGRPGIHRVDPLLGARWTMIACIALIPLLLLSGGLSFALGGLPDLNRPPDHGFDRYFNGDFDPGMYDVVAGSSDAFSGYADEGTSAQMEFNAEAGGEELLASITITLTWEDEPDIRRVVRTFNNEPDTFELRAEWTGDGFLDFLMPINLTGGPTANEEEQAGMITLYHEFEHDSSMSEAGEGSWNIEVIMVEAGDFRANGPALTYYQDTGNDFTLQIETELFTPA